MTLETVTGKWEEAAQRPTARGAIHPTGHHSAEAYIASGVAAAATLAEYLGPPPLEVLDFGAGDGRVAIPLHALGYDVLAVDSSPTMLERLEANAPDLSACQWDGIDPKLDIEDALDAVYALAVLIHHRHADAARLIRNLARAVKPGGLLLLDLPLYETPADPGGWTNVSTWAKPELEAVAELLELDIERALEHKGQYRAGSTHDSLVVLRRRA